MLFRARLNRPRHCQLYLSCWLTFNLLPVVRLFSLASLARCWLTGPFSGSFLLSNQTTKEVSALLV